MIYRLFRIYTKKKIDKNRRDSFNMSGEIFSTFFNVYFYKNIREEYIIKEILKNILLIYIIKSKWKLETFFPSIFNNKKIT